MSLLERLSARQRAMLPARIGKQIYGIGNEVYLLGSGRVLILGRVKHEHQIEIMEEIMGEDLDAVATVHSVTDLGPIPREVHPPGKKPWATHYYALELDRLKPVRTTDADLRHLAADLAKHGYRHGDLQAQNVMADTHGGLRVIDLEAIREMKKNPAPYAAPKDAVALYKRFNRYDPRDVGEFHASFAIPARMIKIGTAKFIIYRSGKVDPATLKKPRTPVSYIHEHDPGVGIFAPWENDYPDDEMVSVPTQFVKVEALVLLGQCLGYGWADIAEESADEQEWKSPSVELYASPGDGRCLYVVKAKRELVAMMWGGKLKVEGRGIVG